MAKKDNEVLRGRVSKELKSVILELPIEGIDWRKPLHVSDKGNASYVFSQKFELEVVDHEGITVPLTASVGLYMTKKDWRNYTEQVQGHREGQVQGTNVVKYTLEQLELLKSKGLLKEEMVQALLEKGLVEL